MIGSVWKLGQPMDLYFYLDEQAAFTDFTNTDKLVVVEKNIGFGDYNDIRTKDFTIPCTQNTQNNGSLYGHFYATLAGVSPEQSSKYPSKILYHRKALTRYMPKKKVIVKKNLIQEEASNENPEIETTLDMAPKNQMVSYWYPNISLTIIANQDPISLRSHPKTAPAIRLDETEMKYLPFFYVNDFWMLSDKLQPINSTVEELQIHFTFEPISMWKMMMYSQFQETFRMQTEMMGVDANETDQVKRMFLDTNIYLLVITMFVSILHSVFDFLAFKNDIKFWKDRKDMEGLSFRSIVINIVFQTIIFLYLLDNDTSYMVCFSTGGRFVD